MLDSACFHNRSRIIELLVQSGVRFDTRGPVRGDGGANDVTYREITHH